MAKFVSELVILAALAIYTVIFTAVAVVTMPILYVVGIGKWIRDALRTNDCISPAE